MPAAIFKQMKVLDRVFKEPGVHYWHRHDADQPVQIQLIFNTTYSEITSDGIKVDEGQPTAFVLIDHALALAPERVGVDLRMLFDNDDELVINGTSYAVESCKPDGYLRVEVRLFRKKSS